MDGCLNKKKEEEEEGEKNEQILDEWVWDVGKCWIPKHGMWIKRWEKSQPFL